METERYFKESKVLEEVRRWRREVYEEDLKLTPEERRRKVEALAKEFGLTIAPSRTEQRKNEQVRPSDHAA